MTASNRRRQLPAVQRRPWPILQRRRAGSGNRARLPARTFSLGRGYLAVFFLVLMMISGAFATHLWVRFEGVRLGYATSLARDERAKLLLERRELRLELASLKAPARVEAEARDKLGMEVPEHARIIPVGKASNQLVASGGAR